MFVFGVSYYLFSLYTVPDCYFVVFWFSKSNLAHSYVVLLSCLDFVVPCSPEASQVIHKKRNLFTSHIFESIESTCWKRNKEASN